MYIIYYTNLFKNILCYSFKMDCVERDPFEHCIESNELILKEYIKDLEEKLKESNENFSRQKRINERIISNYEHLDQQYDKIYALLNEDQKRSLTD